MTEDPKDWEWFFNLVEEYSRELALFYPELNLLEVGTTLRAFTVGMMAGLAAVGSGKVPHIELNAAISRLQDLQTKTRLREDEARRRRKRK